jgi:hypothetical protein
MTDRPSENVDREPAVEPTVEELLLDRIEVHLRLLHQELDQLGRALEQLDPARAHLCRTAVSMARVALDEVARRAWDDGARS